MSWQKCPICEGTGMVTFYNRCSVCNGKKIISEVDGLPPAEQEAELPKGLKEGVLELQKRQYYLNVRHAIKKRLEDPECTLDDMWADYVNVNNL